MRRDHEVKIGECIYTIEQLINNIKTSGSATEAGRWAGFIWRAMAELGDFDEEIAEEVNAILISKGECSFYVSCPKNLTNGPVPPEYLSNEIFKSKYNGKKIDLKKLWIWIYDNIVDRVTYKYEWLSLLLFAKHIGLLNVDSTESFTRQMNEWFKDVLTDRKRVSADQINSYRDSFFNQSKFIFNKWCNQLKVVPDDYELKDDQKEVGFLNIQNKCNHLVSRFKYQDICFT